MHDMQCASVLYTRQPGCTALHDCHVNGIWNTGACQYVVRWHKRSYMLLCTILTGVLTFSMAADMATIDPMYQYSLPWYINLFVSSVHAAPTSEDVPTQLQSIHDHFTYSLYCNVCRSLFEKDKLLFAFLLCTRILGSNGKVDAKEWLFLLTGGLGEIYMYQTQVPSACGELHKSCSRSHLQCMQ